MIATRAGACLVAALVCASPDARASVVVVDGVRVVAPTCPVAPVSVSAFVDSLRVELASGARAPGTTLVTLSIEPCDPATRRVHVAVAGDAGRALAPRDVGLEDIAPEARPRALALAVAELVRSFAPPAPPLAPARAGPPPFALALAAQGVTSLFPGRATALWGGRLSFLVDGPRARLGLFAEAAAGARDFDLGAVSLQSFGGGLVAGPRWSRGRLALCVGAAGAVAWARVQGHAGARDVVAGSGASTIVAARAHADVSASFGRTLSLGVLVEAGYVVRSLDATVAGASDAGVAGPSLVFGLGVGFGP
ncbi:MAG TPA: hypothetical protein VLA14_14405 [Polyangia bacterium]|nr:hypothetical protein [Polyangia bacterium]